MSVMRFGKKQNILLRFDDICPTMNWKQWDIALSLIDAIGVKALLGVIPDCQDPDLKIDMQRCDFWSYIKELQSQGHTIAMHGYKHVFNSDSHGILNRRMNSEFAGLPLDIQKQMIIKGKEILEKHGIYTDVFFAPAHSYDENTVKALSECGFNYVSDGKSRKSYVWHGIKFLPCRNGGAVKVGRSGWYTSIYHTHEWTKNEKKQAYENLKNLTSNYSHLIVSFDEYKKQPEGLSFIQIPIERLFVFWQSRIRPVCVRIFRILVK